MSKAMNLSLAFLALVIQVTAHAQSVSFDYQVVLAKKYAEQIEAEHPCDESASAEWLPCLVALREAVDNEIDIMISRAQDDVYSWKEEGKVVYRANIQAAQDRWKEYRKLQCWHAYGYEPLNSRFKQAINISCELRLSYLRMAEIEQSMFVIPR